MKGSDSLSKSQIELVLLLQDEYSGIDVPETIVIKEQKRLKSFYSKINRTRKPGFLVPEIDFTKEMIVIQCNGEQNYSGLPILSVREETSTHIVIDSKIERKSDDASITVVTNPFCVYKMPFSEKEVLVEQKFK